MHMINGIPRRSRLDLHAPAEKAIRAAVDAVEAAGAHPLLTDAVNLLIAAGDKVADFVELPQPDEKERLWELVRLIFASTVPYDERGECVFSEKVIRLWKELTPNAKLNGGP